MFQGSRSIQDRWTNRRDSMELESGGKMMEKYTLGDSRKCAKLRERFTSCKKIALTLSTMSSSLMTRKDPFLR